MSGTNGRACPECAAPRRPDGTPSCACTLRASDALRDARTADAAAAEDFDPLRIRPYVELDVAAEGTGAAAPAGPAAQEPAGSGAAPDATMRLAAVRMDGSEAAAPAMDGSEAAAAPADRTMRLAAVREGSERAAAPAEETMRLAAVTDGTAPLSAAPEGTAPLSAAPAGSAPPAAAPDATMRLAAVPAGRAASGRSDDTPPRRGRRTTVLLVTGGAVAAAVAVGVAGGLFSYASPKRDGALPEGVRASVPEKPSDATTEPRPTDSATDSATTSATSATPSPRSSPSPSASASTASASPSPSATASHAPPTVPATPTASPTGGDRAPVLRVGDRGPEVGELQLRLRQVGMYFGPVDGVYGDPLGYAVRYYQYSRGIRQDEPGVYGAATRARLESETTEP
ncbi:peptidoglycan-binding protein [Streptomyces sp. NPDC007264]|uniref:peptidoglycan-binding domain-containing protein n=1 Tax=Streptomyces sp. NPDC007264 TaxID=3364777 RepID=UPI0036DDF995